MKKIRIGLYGMNGHQIHNRLKNHPDGEIGAVCISETDWKKLPNYLAIPRYDTLEEMLRDDTLDMISLCSPRRADQEKDAIACLEAGRHVYAEKPALLTEEGLERVLAKANECGKEFHEIADSVFYEPFWSMRKLVRQGKVGEIVQVYAQKSYPNRSGSRPQEEETDGGLIRWVGIHGMRFIEHITGLQVVDVNAIETRIGNENPQCGMFTAAVLSMTLENGGIASLCMNYYNPTGFPSWGNEQVRIFGTRGMIEITDGGRHTHIYTDHDEGEIDTTNSDCVDFLDQLLRHLRYGDPMPMCLEEELHPLRMVIRAKEKAVWVQKS